MYARVLRVKTEVFAPGNMEVTFVLVTRCLRDFTVRQVCVVAMHIISKHIYYRKCLICITIVFRSRCSQFTRTARSYDCYIELYCVIRVICFNSWRFDAIFPGKTWPINELQTAAGQCRVVLKRLIMGLPRYPWRLSPTRFASAF